MKSRNIDNMANKMENAVRGIENNSKMWRLYLSRGGYGSSYFDYNTGFDKKAFSKRNVVQRQFDRIEAVNFAVEQGPRFAEFLSVLENSGEKWGKWSEATLDDAMYAAADVTVNFVS